MPSLKENVFWKCKEGSCRNQLEDRVRCLEKVASELGRVWHLKKWEHIPGGRQQDDGQLGWKRGSSERESRRDGQDLNLRSFESQSQVYAESSAMLLKEDREGQQRWRLVGLKDCCLAAPDTKEPSPEVGSRRISLWKSSGGDIHTFFLLAWVGKGFGRARKWERGATRSLIRSKTYISVLPLQSQLPGGIPGSCSLRHLQSRQEVGFQMLCSLKS